jgi:tetratricopeptide (TPR) repeat protein
MPTWQESKLLSRSSDYQTTTQERETYMRPRFIAFGIRILLLAVAANMGIATVCFAQGAPPSLKGTPPASSSSGQQAPSAQPDPNAPPAAPKLDPAEEAAYKAFFEVPAGSEDTRIQLGTDFVQKYPTSRYLESVYAELVQTYYVKQDWKNFYSYGDKTLALYPDDVTVLTIIGWVIPHVYNPADPDAAKNLDKAEQYEKHAIAVVAVMPKPPGLTDDQFAQSKAAVLSEAHSGLGLVYFRRQNPTESASELQQATQASASPDATDFYVLGLDLQQLSRYPEAADAFTHCSQIMGALQDRCKQSADAARKQAAQPK